MSSGVASNSLDDRGDELWHKFHQNSEPKDNNSAYQCPWAKGSFVEVTDFSDMIKFKKHGAHVMLWCPAKETDIMLDKYPLKYRITMQIRFDGRLGFPGGEVDEMKDFNPTGKTFQDLLSVIKRGLIREVQEELKFKIETETKYIYSSCTSQQMIQCQNFDGTCIPGYIMHFFSCQVPIEALESIEKNTLEILSSDEVLGITRVPLYCMNGNNVGGLPSFLSNSFAGNALEQLMRSCILEGFLTEQQVCFAYYVASTLLQTSK